jgi:hypothetical protein
MKFFNANKKSNRKARVGILIRSIKVTGKGECISLWFKTAEIL